MYINNNIYNNNNNVNFQAKVCVEGMKFPSEKRWANIGKILEQKTAKYPKDSIDIYPCNNGSGSIYLDLIVGDEDSFNTITEKGVKKLFELDDNKIANKILKLFRVHRKNDKITDKAYKLIGFIEKESKKAIQQDSKTFPDYEQIYDCALRVRDKNEEYVISRDSFLNNPDYFRFKGH